MAADRSGAHRPEPLQAALSPLKPFLFCVNGRIVLLADGIKAPKTGRKMPGVRKLHQESQNHSKPEPIFGQSCQVIAVVARAAAGFLAVPLARAFHEGVVLTNRDKRTLPDGFVIMLGSLEIALPHHLVGDTYHAAKPVIGRPRAAGQHLVPAVKSNAVAFKHARSGAVSGRGRARSGRAWRHRSRSSRWPRAKACRNLSQLRAKPIRCRKSLRKTWILTGPKVGSWPREGQLPHS